VLRLGALYRSVAADLALARRRYAGDPVVGRLEDLVGRARPLVYGTARRRPSLLRFFGRDYWRLVAERPVPLLVALVLLFLPAGLAAAWALNDPAAAIGLVPAEFRDVVEKQSFEDAPAAEQAAFSSAVLTNNIQVTAFAFAGGIAAGLITAAALVFNGVLLGAIGGLMIESGHWRAFVDLVTGHGVLELSCIVVGGAAGLRLGWALVVPGYATRTASVVGEARRSIGIVLGTAPWLVVAGIVEGFRAELAAAGIGVVTAVGFGLGALYWTLVFVRGGRET
jgi:uncharacterized membrane protein SpoIIM required for sporulation